MSGKTNAKIAKFRDYSHVRYFDYILLGVVIILLFFGAVMLYSSSSYSASIRYNDPAYYLKRQAVFIVAGVVIMAVTSRLSYMLLKRIAVLAFAVVWLMNVAVIFVGSSGNGSTRWFKIGHGLSIQPSELLKIAIIVFFAYFISKHSDMLGRAGFNFDLLMLLMISVIPVAISNLSTAFIIFVIGFGMLFIASRRKLPLYFIIGFLISVVAFAVPALIKMASAHPENYRLRRIVYWLHPESAPQGEGMQVLQGLYAIGSGRLFGKGLGASITKLGNLPESQNDMIFSVITEELGAFGVVCLILMYVLLLWRLYIVAINARDMFGSFLTIGIFLHLSAQMVLNMLVATNTIPNTGVTLPFISYGGSSLLSTMFEIGIALSVSRNIPLENISLEEDF